MGILLDKDHDRTSVLKASRDSEERALVRNHKDKWEDSRVYLHLRAAEPYQLAEALKHKGCTVPGHNTREGEKVRRKRCWSK
jgi:hypothetical protein